MKIGLFKLKSTKYSPNGWFFIIDTSIQMGSQKCVVVLGIKKIDINQNFQPSFIDVEPLIVRPLTSCPGDIIYQILEEAYSIAGTPLAIISDEGSELKKGGRIFCERHPELGTVHLFDISHKINTCLKKELINDKVWLAFKSAASDTIQKLKLSPIAYLAPPRQRTKDRMHSSFPLMEWHLRLSQFLNNKPATISIEERDKVSWVKDYEVPMKIYASLKEICEEGLKLVHEKGYYIGIENTFMYRTEHLISNKPKINEFRNKIKLILENEGLKVPKGSNYLGSSEVIESLFGKFKSKEGDHACSGLTSLILAIPSFLGEISESIVEKAMQTISLKDVEEWVEKNMGETFLSQRRASLKEQIHTYEDLELCEILN